MYKILWQGAARAAALFVLFGAYVTPTYAFEVTPMRMEISPSGTGASKVITVRNTLAEPLAIEVYATDRIVAEDGSQTFRPNDEDFLLFPPQAFVQPGASQAFRIQYIGDPAPKTSRSYVVNVSQVPLKTTEGTAVQVVYRFGAAVYLHPKNAAASLSVTDVNAGSGEVQVRIENTGDRVAFLTNDKIVISAGGASSTYEWAALKDQVGNPIVPPHSARVLTFEDKNVRPGAQVSAVIHPKDD